MNGAQRLPMALLQQVLDVYRQPLCYRTLWADPRRALPEGVGELLDLALATPEALDRPAARLHASREELAAALHFFIRQVLLAEESDAYRMLGLTPAATPAQIQSHYRKLMRLYHPDRDAGNEWNKIYAPRINQAYSLLRHPDRHPACASPMPSDKPAAWKSPLPCASPQTATKTAGQRLPAGILARCGSSRLRACGFAISCVAVAAGVGFILWNLLTWPMLSEPPRPPSTVSAATHPQPAPLSLPPENVPTAPAKPTAPETVPVGLEAARIVPKSVGQMTEQGHRR